MSSRAHRAVKRTSASGRRESAEPRPCDRRRDITEQPGRDLLGGIPVENPSLFTRYEVFSGGGFHQDGISPAPVQSFYRLLFIRRAINTVTSA